MMTRIKHLYIHVPFCKSICSYCDFCHRVYNKDLSDKWLKRIIKEFKECNDEQYETIYIGGGTPTSLTDQQLEKLFKLIKTHTNKVKEYSIEVNPESLTFNKIKLFNKYGINRVSMGLQSSNDRLLKLMNRHHSFGDVSKACKLLKDNGIDNISLDIMYSIPTQTMNDLIKTIDDALSLKVPHLSLYSLTIEENTVFGKKGYTPLDEEIEADMYEYIIDTLKKNKYEYYEIANFARKGYESKHNLGYWRYEDFRGLGCGSSSKIGSIRYDKTKDINKYINSKDIIETTYKLSKDDKMFENIMMSLRTLEGLDIYKFNKKYNVDILDNYKEAINKNKRNIIIKEGRLIVKNRMILNSILIDFLK
ncbi:MAG: radical SAM family heme chaperone HemW [Erysipelotrichaceae bacterium]|nr:radical SAM family heme chaperone HemW [Erysipelotrichaceae bacterium]